MAVELSLVFPIYNEQDMLPMLRRALDDFFFAWDQEIEFVMVNDGSEDRSIDFLRNWAKEDPRVTIIELKTNQGHQRALYEGLVKASGEYVITLDADLQDPLEYIPVMLEQAKAGFDVVHARRRTREGEVLFKKAAAWTFYRTIKLVHGETILDAGDFRLMTKKAIDMYARKFGPESVLRIGIPRLRLNQTTIEYDRKPRLIGKSKFTLRKLVQLANQARK